MFTISKSKQTAEKFVNKCRWWLWYIPADVRHEIHLDLSEKSKKICFLFSRIYFYMYEPNCFFLILSGASHRKYTIKALVVSWWRSNTKEVKNWAQCGTYFNANICMISFSKEKISRPLCQIANQRLWPTIYASLYHHSYSTMLKNSKNNSFLHQIFLSR